MCLLNFRVIVVLLLLAIACAAQSNPQPRTVDLTAADGTALKATYFAAAKPGPGVLLLHQCNQQRKSWDVLAEAMNRAGIHVLTLDYRGYGESGGPRFDKLPPDETTRVTRELWPGDIDVAYRYLLAQPGVQRDRIGAGGASCGVNNSIQLARRHPEVKALMLLSGGTDPDGRLFLQKSARLPVFTAAADDDVFGNVSQTMQWLFTVSQNSASRFKRYANGGHGAELFAPHPELTGIIAAWFQATLNDQSDKLPSTNGARFSAQEAQMLDLIDKPNGAAQASQTLADARARDAKAQLFPETAVNFLGYEHLQAGDTKGAIHIFKLNVSAYPDSPNVYDSLSDAYLADGQKDLALTNAKKALDLLARDTTDPEERKKGIQQSAEHKVKQLEPAHQGSSQK